MKELCKKCGKEFDETEYSQKIKTGKINNVNKLNIADVTCIKCSS